MKKVAGYVAIFVIGFVVCAFVLKVNYPKTDIKTNYIPSIVSGKGIPSDDNAIKVAAGKISKYVVNIDTVGTPQVFNNGFYGMSQETPKGMASGVIISKDGYILTNNHVVADATDVMVTLYNEKQYKAKIIGTDPRTDLAVVKINVKESLHYADFANSENLAVGDWVIAVGNALGLGPTVTSGIVSAKRDKFDLNGMAFDSIIQTDAAINRGNSGGALSDLHGNLIGINTAIATTGSSDGSIGIGFAVPSNTAKKISSELIKTGSIKRAWVGIGMQLYNEEYRKHLESQGVPWIPKKDGILVANVYPKSPAAKAGVERGDIIIKIDGKSIKIKKTGDSSKVLMSLSTAISNKRVGDKLKITIIRDNKEKNINIKLEAMPSEDKLNAMNPQPQQAPQQGDGMGGGMFPFPFFGQP